MNSRVYNRSSSRRYLHTHKKNRHQPETQVMGFSLMCSFIIILQSYWSILVNYITSKYFTGWTVGYNESCTLVMYKLYNNSLHKTCMMYRIVYTKLSYSLLSPRGIYELDILRVDTSSVGSIFITTFSSGFNNWMKLRRHSLCTASIFKIREGHSNRGMTFQ